MFWLSPPDNFAGWRNRAKSLQTRIVTINISGDRVFETVEYVREKWQIFDQEHPFEFQFLDASLDKLYTSNRNQMKLIGLFAGLCIFISCLGLFGLTAFTIEQRTKEIGVRKVLGASSWQIIMMLFKNVFNIVVVAAVVASGISYWIMTEWLKGFYYHDDINPFVFLIAAALTITIAFLTIAAQSYKTARANPVQSLRFE